MYDRAAIKFDIYQRLNKSPSTRGFYTDEKCNSAIQEALDFVATEMFEADQGWLKKIGYLDVTANCLTLAVPSHMEMIENVRYLLGNIYQQLAYDTRFDSQEWAVTSGATQLPVSYRIVDNKFYFNPPIGVGGENFLQIEYMQYPTMLRTDAQKMDPQFGRALNWYIVYRAMSIMASSIGQFNKAWAQEEGAWYSKMLTVVNKRNLAPTPIKEFCGY